MRIRKQLLRILIFALILIVAIASVYAWSAATRNFQTKTDNNAIVYVCEDTPYSVAISGDGNGYTFSENLPVGWSYTGVSVGTSICTLSGSPANQVNCGQGGVTGNTISLSVSNTGAGDVIGPGTLSGTFSGTYTYTATLPTTIGGINQIYVKSRLCRPDNDGDNYHGNPTVANIDCYCSGKDCDDDMSDDPVGCPSSPGACTQSTAACAICIHPGATDYCENGIDEDCVGGDAPCASRLAREAPATYEVGKNITINLTMIGALSENSLVVDEQFDSNRFRVVKASNKGNGLDVGHVKWIIYNPQPSAIVTKMLTYELQPKGTCPEAVPTQFSGQYHYAGRSVGNIGADSIVPISREDQCSIGTPAEPCCGDGYDNDCDGDVDCADSDCAGATSLGGTVCCTNDAHCTGTLGVTGECGKEFCNTTLSLCDIQTGNELCLDSSLNVDYDKICNATYSCVDACLGQCGFVYSVCVPKYGDPPCTAHVCYGDCSGASGGNNTMGGYVC